MNTWKTRWIISQQSCQFLPCDSELKLVSWWVNNFWKKKIFDASQLNEIFFDCSADSRTSLAWFHGTSLLAANSIKAASRGEYPTQFQPPNRSTMRARVSRLSSRSFARRTILLVQLYSSILFPSSLLFALLPTGYRSKSSVNIPENEVLRSFQERCKLVSFVSFNLSKLLDMINNRFHLHL